MKYVSFLSFFTFVAIFSTPIFFTQRIYAVVSPRGRHVDPLDQHAMHGLTKMGRFFARTRAEIEKTPDIQQPSIFKAIVKKNWKRVMELIQKDPELVHKKALPSDLKPLHIAAMRGAPLDVIELLVSKGANVSEQIDKTSPKGWSVTLYPIHAAALGGHLDVIKYFAERHVGGIKVPLLLHMAASSGKADVVKYLVEEKGRSIDELGPDGATPLHDAAGTKDIGALRYLLSKGAKVNAETKRGRTPIAGALWGKNRLPFVKLLVDHGADITVRTPTKGTLLHNVASFSHPSVMKFFLGKNVIDVNAQDKFGNTALHYVRPAWSRTSIASLIQKIRYLLNAGARVDIRNKLGQTALHTLVRTLERLSVEQSDISRIILLLRKHGADITVKDNEGKVAADYSSIPAIKALLQ